MTEINSYTIIKTVASCWPEDTAWEQDLIVQLLGRTSTDSHTLLVIHLNMVPHVVGGRYRADMVDLKHRQKESKIQASNTCTWNVWKEDEMKVKEKSVTYCNYEYFLLLHKRGFKHLGVSLK